MEDTITVVIHTYNAENDIEECIASAKLLTNSVNLVDMESTDKTVEIAKRNGAAIFNVPMTHYVEPVREFGIRTAKSDWVFILDADERITPELAGEIKRNVIARTVATGRSNPVTNNPKDDLLTTTTFYKVPRKNIFGKKKWLQHGNWWPDYQTRLIKMSAFKTWPKKIHSTPQIDGKLSLLKNPILHYFHGDIETMVEKTTLFEDIESGLLYEADRAVSTPIFFRKFFGELFRRLIKHKGFLDGEVGIIENVYQAFSKTITYLYLYEKKNSRPL